ncbi:hypothetical protein K9M47_01365 [Candidatus Gracilibacteria bacterium]|nr:hypothetical protein [Candidatus Gracilibacteria bacterium]MCF7899012.1 hypothetical protein [Candidatus Paceibacterota bacterium]
MTLFKKTLGTLSIVLGYLVIFLGILASSSTQLESAHSVNLIIGGGIFIASGISMFFLNKND